MTYTPWLRADGTPRYFGVEMELRRTTTSGAPLTGEMLKQGLRNARVPRLNRRAPGYYHSNGETWDVKTDSSCGWEVASPKLELDATGNCNQLERACIGLTATAPAIDRTCGLHVHVDVSDFDWRDFQRLIALWARYEPFFFEITPPSRRSNTYCMPVRRATWRSGDVGAYIHVQYALHSTTDREFRQHIGYFPRGAINVAAFFLRGTVEFRLQGGTINYEKIRNWTIMLLALVNRAKTPLAPPVPLEIVQPRPELGFSVRYIFQVLGLAPNRWAPEVPAICASVETWATERRVAMAGNSQSVNF